MAGMKTLAVVALAALASANDCPNSNPMTVSEQTWLPTHPMVGYATYVVLSGSSDADGDILLGGCTVTFTQGSYSFNSPPIECQGWWSGPSTFNVQTEPVYVPTDAPTGAYTTLVTGYDPYGEALACWDGSIFVVQNTQVVSSDCVSGDMKAVNVTWTPAKVTLGDSCYASVTGTNSANYVQNVYACGINLYKGSNYYWSTSTTAPCSSGPINSGGNFTIETEDVYFPWSLPAGNYTGQVVGYAYNGKYVGCWSAELELVHDSGLKVFN